MLKRYIEWVKVKLWEMQGDWERRHAKVLPPITTYCSVVGGERYEPKIDR